MGAERGPGPPKKVPRLGTPLPTGDTTTSTPALIKASRRRDFIARHWTIACLDRVCVNCGCGRSLEFELREEAADPDGYDLTA